jgi:hypothetical protein
VRDRLPVLEEPFETEKCIPLPPIAEVTLSTSMLISGKKTRRLFAMPFDTSLQNGITLSRQARNKHRERTQKERLVSAGYIHEDDFAAAIGAENVFFAPFRTKHRTFAKTGSGQT